MLDIIGKLGTPMDTDKVLQIPRIDPFRSASAHIDARKALVRVRVACVAADLLYADLQDVRHLFKGQKRLTLFFARARHVWTIGGLSAFESDVRDASQHGSCR